MVRVVAFIERPNKALFRYIVEFADLIAFDEAIMLARLKKAFQALSFNHVACLPMPNQNPCDHRVISMHNRNCAVCGTHTTIRG